MNKVTNLSILENLTANDREKIIKYINMYLQHTPELLNRLKSSTQKQQWPEVKNAAHSLSPQLHYMGMEAIKIKVQEIETRARDGKDLENILEIINEVEQSCNNSFRELNDYLKSHNKKSKQSEY